jgi:metal-responsive CopG/Arc/MetJ family transcriptional regulator
MKKRSEIVSKVVSKGIQKRHKRNEGREGILNAKAKRG